MSGQNFAEPTQPAEPPEISSTAYKTGDYRSRAHLPDPYLPEPKHDWVYAPYGWTVHSLCGLVIRRAREARGDDEMCSKCMGKALRLLRDRRAS